MRRLHHLMELVNELQKTEEMIALHNDDEFQVIKNQFKAIEAKQVAAVLEEAKRLAAWAKAKATQGGVEAPSDSGKRDSLSEVIKTEEQAKVFITLLKLY